jgi:hypothetical protein
VTDCPCGRDVHQMPVVPDRAGQQVMQPVRPVPSAGR